MSISALIGFTFWSPSSPDHARSLLNEAVLWLQLWRLFAALDPARQVTFISDSGHHSHSFNTLINNWCHQDPLQHLHHWLLFTSWPVCPWSPLSSSISTPSPPYPPLRPPSPSRSPSLSQELEEASSGVHGELVPKRGRWWSPLARLVLMMRSF